MLQFLFATPLSDTCMLSEPPVARRIDNPALSLIEYSIQSNRSPLAIRCRHGIGDHDSRIAAEVLRWYGVLITGM